MKSSIPSGPRHARVRALAKINISLRVLNKREDGFHELRTILQTISLGDRIGIEYEPARNTSFEISSTIDIEDNLVIRAARLIMDEMRVAGRVSFELEKQIPMGGGLGGGSSDAAAVLLALPVLTGRDVPLDRLTAVASELGSDVPFFLLGGTVLGVGRGDGVASPARDAATERPAGLSGRRGFNAGSLPGAGPWIDIRARL